MTDVLLIQLPVPQLNFGHQTGNIPFAAACLQQAAQQIKTVKVEIVPQTIASYGGDAAILSYILQRRPDIIGFTAYLWNVQRTLHLAKQIKRRYSPRIILGGPEVTPDNPLVHDSAIDFCAYGEGEILFTDLLSNPDAWSQPRRYENNTTCFAINPSPYQYVPLAPELEGTMLLETMRGCPHRCAYCYYNKSHARLSFKEDRLVLEGVRWAMDHDIKEIYLLDPSLNSRPGLKNLLKKISRLNVDRKFSLISEIRADFIDEELADLLAAAGFRWLEIGLQSTNPLALKAMRRHTDLNDFVIGAHRLAKRNITAAVDLIVGLPGDDPAGFDRTTQFVVANNLHQDIQVFPLSLIPGTEFRRRHKELGLIYDDTPPYTVISTPGFTRQAMDEAFDVAEERFDVALYPLPDLDLTYRTTRHTDLEHSQDIEVAWDGQALLYKIVLNQYRSSADYSAMAHRVTHPYQLLVPRVIDHDQVASALSAFTAINPYTPLEIVFFAPRQIPDVERLLRSARLARPSYLDKDLRLLYREPGNRTILFTIVSQHLEKRFSGPMQRQIFWWQKQALPNKEEVEQIETRGFDGILIDPNLSASEIRRWQGRMAPLVDDMMLIAFANCELHRHWLQETSSEDYCLQILP